MTAERIERSGYREEPAAQVDGMRRLRESGIRPGALADLLIVDGDPTGDITVLQQPGLRRAVVKDGRFAYVNPELSP